MITGGGLLSRIRPEPAEARWRRPLPVEEFVTMSASSAQAQPAIAAVGPEFLNRVRELCGRHADGGRVEVPYVSEAFYGVAAP
ncbi:hypothetical protein [Streptomyces sp. NPDC048516]|uniref:hypothetical protein n=1 Tax=Streptomyces sp. NPDC048516 TaxID=3365565 RepID=UPI0037163312